MRDKDKFYRRCSVYLLGQSCRAALLLCVFGASLGVAQSNPASDAKPATKSDFSKEALVWDKLYTHIREEADGTGERKTTARARIIADAGVKEMAVLTFTYTADDQQIDIAYVRVIKPDGTVVATPAYNIQDLPADVTRAAPMYSDIHQKHVAVKGLGVGDTLEYETTLRTVKPELPGHFWFEYSFEEDTVVLDEQLDLDLPADKPVKVNCAGLQPTISTAGSRKLYHWSSSNLARPDPDAPAKSVKNWKPSVQVTTFASWEQVGAWYQSLQRGQLAVTPAIQAKADALTKGLVGDEAKLTAIFNEVALHIHYVGLEFGIGRYQPHPADDVLSNEYGDCKDKHTLLAALLKAAGIEAWPVLINSRRELDPDTPSPGQFDHVITLVPLAGKLVWMDSTAEVIPAGILGANLRDKQALAVPAGKPASLQRTAAELPYAQTAAVTTDGEISATGLFTGRIVLDYHGDAEMLMRNAFRMVPQSQWKEFLQRVSSSAGFGGDVKNPEVSAIEQTSQPLHFSYDYTREHYSEWDDHRISPPLPPMGWEIAPGVKQKKPADDIEIGSPGENVYTSHIRLPKGWMLYPPGKSALVEDWAEYHSNYSFKDGVFTAERRLLVKKSKVPIAQWDKYLTFRIAIYEDAVRMASVSNAEGGASIGAAAFGSPDTRFYEMEQQQTELQTPLIDINALLEPSPQPDQAEAILHQSRVALEAVEAHTALLPGDDKYSLLWAKTLSLAWCTHGWTALEAHDLAIADSYLHSAWRLSQDRVSGYLYGRLLEAKGEKNAAARQYEIASVAPVSTPIGGLNVSRFDVDRSLHENYQKLTGKPLTATLLNHGAYDGSLEADLDRMVEVKQLLHTTTLAGSALYLLTFENGQPMKVSFLQGDKGFANLTAALKAHSFSTELPTGSKARLVREARIICSPYAGCDAELLRPTSLVMSMPITFAPVVTHTEIKPPAQIKEVKPAPSETKSGVVDLIP
jgi:hypothetical protein